MPDEQNHSYEFDEFRIDVQKRQLTRAGELVPLYSKAFDLLLTLIRNGGRDLSKDELLESVWPDQVLEEANLTVTMSVVRKALGERATRPRYIVTIPGHGYRFVGDLNKSDGLIIETESIAQVTIDQETADDALEATVDEAGLHSTPNQSTLPGQSRTLALPAAKQRSSKILVASLIVGGCLLVLIAGVYAVIRIERGRVRSPRFAQVKIVPITNIGGVGNVAWSPDGKLFAFSRMENDRDAMSLRLGQLNGDRDIELLPPGNLIFRGIEFSRDGSTIYYSVQEVGQPGYKLFKISALGGAPTRLREKIDQRFTLSPDETQVAFERSTPDKTRSLIVSGVDGANEHALLTLPTDRGLQASVSWSPDDSNIAVAATRDAKEQNLAILLMPVQGGTPKPLGTATWREITRLTWLKDGSGLLVIGAGPDLQEVRQVWFVSYPGGEAHRITDEPTIYDVGLSVGSDPNRFLLVQQKQINNLWLGPANDPGHARQVTFAGPLTLSGAFAFDWLPDNRIVYAAPKGQGFSISVMNSDGKEAKELTPAGAGDSVPATTADGRFIVFQSNRTGSDQVWRIDANGSNAKQLTNCGDSNGLPDVSPDGKWVVYVSNCEGVHALWRVSLDGDQPKRLTDRAVEWPWISPDSKWVAAGYSESGKLKLGMFSIDGGPAVKAFDVAPKTIFHFGIRWTPDGKAIAYRDFWHGLWTQSLDGGPPQRIPDLPEGKMGSFGWSRDGKLFAFVRANEFRDLVLISNVN